MIDAMLAMPNAKEKTYTEANGTHDGHGDEVQHGALEPLPKGRSP
jgi:hypothetical protein